MSSTMEHFSHPKHQLILKENDVIGVDALCYGCEKPVIGSPTYTCTSNNVNCQSFYLHKTCAEIPPQIIHPEHNSHSLALQPRFRCSCDVCYRRVKSFAYTCIDCDFDVCIVCASLCASPCTSVSVPEQRELHHESHQEHALTLQREAFFKCDACYEEGKDSSYVCITCDFWVHKKCALSPSLIPAPSYHHHPLSLIYSIPPMHRCFSRYCQICKKRVQVFCWHYYCHKCTYFVHMKCATSSDTLSMLNENEADDTENEPDLVQFPLPYEESLLDLIITQCTKLQLDFSGEGKHNSTISTKSNAPHVIEEHWSHKNHPLEQLHFIIGKNDDDADDRRVLTCNGCIQNITISHPTYYACVQCGFFLHSFCATKLPRFLPVGASQLHPQHSLLLQKKDTFYSLVRCGVCVYPTNGFYYDCETCDMKLDIRCAFLPSRIKHVSHRHHSLFLRPNSNSECSVSRVWIEGMEYACETCNSFQVNIDCSIYPSMTKHGYDDHPITLRLPPFFYEGALYCEICEDRLNNQFVLYHCGECDHSFHNYCIARFDCVKLGGTIELSVGNQPHKLALVLKSGSASNSPMYFCDYCLDGSYEDFFLECEGCGYLACLKCVNRILGK